MNETSPGNLDRPIVETMTQARQGVTGHNVRYVLGFGLTGAVIALFALYLFYFAG